MNAQLKELDISPGLFQVPYWDIESVWPKASIMLKKAIDRQDYWTIEGVYKIICDSPTMILTNQMQLWYCPNKYALVTQIQVNCDGKRVCLLFLCGGEDLNVIRQGLPIVKEWAKRYFGCSYLRIVGREGWVKILEGFEKKEVIMECSI